MIRTALRPLARILSAWENGESPNVIGQDHLYQRHEAREARARTRAKNRLLVVSGLFALAFVVISGRMAIVARSEPYEPVANGPGAVIANQRADIVDRKGRALAFNFKTHALYAQPLMMVDPIAAAKGLVRIFPELDEQRLIREFTGKRKFLWIKKRISPEQKQAVHDIGEPGLLFAAREMRLYPNGKLAAHVLGGASFGRESVSSAEVIGVAGVEKQFDTYLRDPANADKPLTLSLDLTIQAAMDHVLYGGMRLMGAKGAAGILMDVNTGEVIAVSSLPTFDPNERPRVSIPGEDPGDNPLFNRAVQGVYELGSTFKIFTAAQAMHLGLMDPETLVNTRGPLRWGRFRISDFRDNGDALTLARVIVKSSNIGMARVAQMIGAERQKQFLAALGMFDPTPFEIVEASGSQPLLPKRWSELSTMTVSYGHGISISPMHLAAGYAAIANGGRYVRPTVLKQDGPQPGPRVMTPASAAAARKMLRAVVTGSTTGLAEVSGYAVGGKTGTADKPDPRGGYYEDKVIATFATVFPAHDPKYTLVVTLDEPGIHIMGETRRTAGWTAAPVAAELIKRVAPLLGLRPQPEPGQASDTEDIKLALN